MLSFPAAMLRLLLLLACVVPTARAAHAQSAAAPAGARMPAPHEVLDVSPEVLDLRRDLERIVRAAAAGETRTALLVISLDRGDTLVSLHPDVPLSPASNMKLYSTAAALYFLGPDFRFSTSLLADGDARDGVLHGDLILYGTGDPAISSRLLRDALAPFRAFADSLASLGVRTVRGDLVGDGSYFDDQWIGPGWLESDLMASYGAPVGALSFSENVVSVRLEPGPAGGPARIRTVPATRGLAIDNRVRTVASGATQVAFSRGRDGIVVTGQIRVGSTPVTRAVPVVDPANFAAAALASVLESRGIRLEGRVRSVRFAAESRVPFGGGGAASPTGLPPRVLAIHQSPPVSDLVRVTNHVSQNMYAEALLKAVGRAASGEGSFEGGGRAVRHLLERETVAPATDLALIDGSGLSRTNRLTARATVHLLEYMIRSELSETYSSSLPRAGSSSGLRRMFDSAAAGNLHAKTGTIRNVSALGGYVVSAGGERLAFSMITNGIPATSRAKQAEDEVGVRLARFRR
jgi:serine-type D-Ala-D-Ala carboxypeptidase/endopeptidase (penicillin-binding protein 4)